MRPHNTSVVRRARLYTDGRTLVVRDRRLRERRYAVGAGGIRRAVFTPPGDLWETVVKRSAERWGVLAFQGEDGRTILRVPLAEWLPEAQVVGVLDLRPSKCLKRTGLRELVTSLGIPLEESPRSGDVGEEPGGGLGDKSDRAVHAELPRWHSWARGIGWFGWLIALGVGFAAAPDWGFPVAAVALFLVPAADAVVRVGAWWRNRRDVWPTDTVVITPSPEADAGATRRFCRTACVRVLPREVVLTNTVGEERRLGRNGAHGVARLVRLVASKTGEPLGVEFRDGEGEARVLLPWRYWFGGVQGDERWAALRSALGVPVMDEEVRHGRESTRGSKGTQPWWTGHTLAADAHRMSPMDAKEARDSTNWHSAVIGSNEVLIISIFSLPLLPGILSDRGPALLAGVLSALTIVGELGPAAVDALISRCSYDRPHSAAADTPTTPEPS
ncbi:hypothetical protein [Streptomyces sp. 142MFCol3.1]|uniref:hypothetical protein n=1 Tax=Streptomyces sp. 142MFCol3.1 TaxID=1172179 RepID=UPI000403210E|nr:hypothetical protein [Streptomyces sp. 142MFCol3.1]